MEDSVIIDGNCVAPILEIKILGDVVADFSKEKNVDLINNSKAIISMGLQFYTYPYKDYVIKGLGLNLKREGLELLKLYDEKNKDSGLESTINLLEKEWVAENNEFQENVRWIISGSHLKSTCK
jgi:hypothetical protein